MSDPRERVLRAVEELAEELVDFAATLVRIPTVNPPGEHYREAAETIGARLASFGFEVDYPVAEASAEHDDRYPRVNVVGLRRGGAERPLLHLNGHFDVVPAGEGWTVDPFGGEVRDGRLYGRGSADMKAGLAAAMYAAEAVRRAGVELGGSLEISGTVDEESGGFAGVAFLAESGRISVDRTDWVIIPEPLDVDRICVGHRGVYWFRVTAHGRTAHGSMPFAGVSAIDRMAALQERIRRELQPGLERRRTAMPVVPEAARRGTLNVNAIRGGQAGEWPQTPCVADRCEAIFDRRFLLETGFERTREEIRAILAAMEAEQPDCSFELEDLMVVHPTRTPDESPLVRSLGDSIAAVLGREATLVASPGTYDHKHVARIAGVEHCVAYGPGRLEQAHQPDEWCSVDELVDATRVLALTTLELLT